jgi:hypothetical protein
MSEQKPSIGRIVHYVRGVNTAYGVEAATGVHDPAIVTSINDNGTLNLVTFSDSSSGDKYPVWWREEVAEDQTGANPNSWHWPEQV